MDLDLWVVVYDFCARKVKVVVLTVLIYAALC
jgi:hypothetical protein